MSKLAGQWCDNLFGTLPSTNRRAPVMPRFPTTTRSASVLLATFTSASTGSPVTQCEVIGRHHLVGVNNVEHCTAQPRLVDRGPTGWSLACNSWPPTYSEPSTARHERSRRRRMGAMDFDPRSAG